MMSDSDDTDVLLLIPPDLFIVPSSDSDDSSSNGSNYKQNKSGVVSELIDHVQSLEFRISAIESKDSPNNSLSFNRRLSVDSIMSCGQTLPRTKFCVSQNSNLQNTPIKYPQCSSLPSTPSIHQKLRYANEKQHAIKSYENNQNNASISNIWNEHDNSKFILEPVFQQTALQNKSLLHAGSGSSEKELHSVLLPALNVCENNVYSNTNSSLSILNIPDTLAGYFSSDSITVKDMSLPEIEAYLQEIETNDKCLGKSDHGNGQIQVEIKEKSEKRNHPIEKDDQDKKRIKDKSKLKFNTNDCNFIHESVNRLDYEKRKDFSDFTLPNDSSFSSFDTEKFMAEFKPWTPSFQHELNDSKISAIEQIICEENDKIVCPQQKEKIQEINETNNQTYIPNNTNFSSGLKKESNHRHLDLSLISKFADELTKSEIVSSPLSGLNQDMFVGGCKSCPSIFKASNNEPTSNASDTLLKKSEISNNIPNVNNSEEQNHVNSVNKIEQRNHRAQRLLTLSDFWNNDSNKSQEEQLRIRLEEERFRREHCEHIIQDLQKKLLEQQEKVAVAIRVDNEKNLLISQFQITWKKMKRKHFELESERENLQKVLKNISVKHQSEISDHQEQIKKYKEELSKALNLATGYKEKSDNLVKEKIDLLKSHANELENYKSLVQQAENRYEEMKVKCQKLLEKNQQTDETLKIVQQDLNKELLKGGEVRAEMTVIHKALDACEAELTILRQEKENLQLKLKEEVNRNNILEQGKISLIAAIDEARKAEKIAKNEVKTLNEQQEKLRAELRDVYQKQVDDVVKAKLQEFQTQLDSAEMVYQNELETKQRAIAECAARKIKSVIDKHQLEINLVEEKHKEEKRLFEIKLAQAKQKAAILEAQLNSYRKSKNQLVEQLHSMMQKQWQQALLIISGGNTENMSSFKKFNVDKLFEYPYETNSELLANVCGASSEPIKLESQKSSTNLQNLQMQEHENESLVTLTSHDDTPLTSRKESKNDLRKYLKMILDIQQSKEEYVKPKFFGNSPPSSHKEKSEIQFLQKDLNTSNDGSSTWQPTSEISIHDTSEYLSVPQKFSSKNDQQKQKPPWK